MPPNNARIFASLAMIALLTGCVRTSPPAQFYLLESLRESSASAKNDEASSVVIVVGPIHIPKYADRPQMITAAGHHRYQLDEYHRWAERLDDNMVRVLVQNLGVLLPASQVLPGGPETPKHADLRVSVNILEFLVDTEDEAQLVAQWNIVKNRTFVLSQKSSYRIPVLKKDPQARVAALNETLNRLSREIASALRGIPVSELEESR
jgi:uncharacterized lipoprotein YmbA